MEFNSLLNNLKTPAMMSLFVSFYRITVPMSSVWLALVPVGLSGAVYGVLVLKFDRKVYEELKGIVMQMNVACPKMVVMREKPFDQIYLKYIM